MLLYPVAIVIMAVLLSGYRWLWIIAVICGFAWLGAICVFLSNVFRREGYQAALDDLKNDIA
jgi:F0F1-type ATP synthase assembly protein I